LPIYLLGLRAFLNNLYKLFFFFKVEHYFILAFVAKWLFAFFRIYFPSWQHVSIFIFLILFIFSFVLFPPVLQSLENPPLRDWTHCQFYFLLVFLWFDVDLYNITILHGSRMRTHESGWISNLQSKVFLKVFMPWPIPNHIYLQWHI